VSTLETLLAASVELALLRHENRQLREELAAMRAERTYGDLSADSTPALLRRQAE
jgi:hypothetical protein